MLVAVAVVWSLGFAPVRAETVDLELVFAADGSGSIDDEELRLQRDGYAAALSDPKVLGAIAGGLHGRIAVAYIEWGGPASQHTIVDWTVIAGPADAAAFGRALRTAPRAAWGYNSISEAIAYSAGLIHGNDIDSDRKVIDVSGDGPQIGGRPLDLVGGLLEVLATDPAAMLDFRHYARQSGHTLVSAEEGAEEGAVLRFVLRRES